MHKQLRIGNLDRLCVLRSRANRYLVDAAVIRSIQAGVRYTDRDARREYANRFSRPATLTNVNALPVEFDVFGGVGVGGTLRWTARDARCAARKRTQAGAS